MNWPQQAKVAQVTVKNANTIRKGFKESFDTKAIVSAWDEGHFEKGSITSQGARDWSRAHVIAKRKPLELALARTYADGYVLGDKIARARILGAIVHKSLDTNTVDWSNWTPGMESAAALVKPKNGLRMLLDSRKIVIADDIIDTKLDRIGTALYNGLQKGFGPAEIARMIDSVINDPQHAMVIARTETSRALSIANRDQYESSNVKQVEWLVAEGCEDCQENADASPIGIDETFPTGDSEPPAHPNCVCALAPYFDDSDLPPAEQQDYYDAEYDSEE